MCGLALTLLVAAWEAKEIGKRPACPLFHFAILYLRKNKCV